MYQCMECKNNNNGWCEILKINGLKKKKIENCENFKGNETVLEIIKGKDGIGQDDLTINIDGVQAYLPMDIVLDFLNNKEKNGLRVKIPN